MQEWNKLVIESFTQPNQYIYKKICFQFYSGWIIYSKQSKFKIKI